MTALNADTTMAGGTTLVAIFLSLWQWYDRRARQGDLEPRDRVFFHRQDVRRSIGIGMMLLLAGAIFIVDPSETSWSPTSLWQCGQLANLFGLVALILGLLVLALFNALATMRYARRHRRDFTREHAKLMLEAIRRTGSSDSIRRVAHKRRDVTEA